MTTLDDILNEASLQAWIQRKLHRLTTEQLRAVRQFIMRLLGKSEAA
jgi:hypothetical protein